MFIKNKLFLKGNNKTEYFINFNLRNIKFTNNGIPKLFQIIYLTKYVARLRYLNKFRNNLYHNLFTYSKAKNINKIIQNIKTLIDFDFIPYGSYNDYEFVEDYYSKLSKLSGFAKEVELKRKSLLSSQGQFPPDKYVSINMLLRIMFYHYSFTFMTLKNGVNY